MNERDSHKAVANILLSAGSLFSNAGYHGTSIREIAKHARVNLAAVNYHFGDKESLYCEIIVRGLRSINEKRLDRLDQAGETAGAEPIPLTHIIEIFARPIFEMLAVQENGESDMMRLIGRSLIDPLPFMDDVLAAELHPVTTRFAQAIRRHAPSIAPAEFMWRINFVVGAMHHTAANLHRMTELTHGLCKDNDSASALLYFTQFAATSLSAPRLSVEK